MAIRACRAALAACEAALMAAWGARGPEEEWRWREPWEPWSRTRKRRWQRKQAKSGRSGQRWKQVDKAEAAQRPSEMQVDPTPTPVWEPLATVGAAVATRERWADSAPIERPDGGASEEKPPDKPPDEPAGGEVDEFGDRNRRVTLSDLGERAGTEVGPFE